MFRTNRPATADAFHDRVEELRRLKELVGSLIDGEPSWLAIIGPRKVGKTSLILELERSYSENVSFISLDAENQRPLSWELFRTYALKAADALLGRDLPASLEVTSTMGDAYLETLLASKQVGTLSNDLQRTLRALPQQKMDQTFIRLCLDLPEKLAEALDRHVVIAFDEFQQLSTDWSLKKSDPLPVLRSAWQKHERVAYIVSGSGRSMLEAMVTREHSPFFQHFSLMNLERFSASDAVDLLVRASPEERPISKEIAIKGVRAVGGLPYYVQLLGQQLTGHEPPYDERSLKEAVQELLFDRSGRLALYFQNTYDRLVGSSTYLAAVLTSVSDGPKRVTDIATELRTRTGDVARYLERLGDAVVRDEDGRYRLEDATFGLWLAWRKPGGTVVPMTLVGDVAEKEVAQRLARMGFELVYQSRASRGAFDLLAIRGPDQLGVQVKRSELPLRFTKESWSRMVADSKRFGWKWLVASVGAENRVAFHDPLKARHGREVRLTQASTVENVSQWIIENR